MRTFLLSLLILFIIVSQSQAQEVILTRYEEFATEPGRILKHESKHIGAAYQCNIWLNKLTDVDIDSTRRVIIFSGSGNQGNWTMHVDQAAAYGVLRFLEYCKRVVAPDAKANPVYSYLTINGMQVSFNASTRFISNRWAIHFRQVYAYSNTPVSENAFEFPFSDIDQLITLWKNALEASKEF